MSTWLYLECRSHDPVLTSDAEVGQHTYDLPDIRKRLADRDRLVQLVAQMEAADLDPYAVADRYYVNTLSFIARHPKCDIGVRDEYGNDHPLTEEDA